MAASIKAFIPIFIILGLEKTSNSLMYKQLHKPNSNPVKKESTWGLDIQADSEKPSLSAFTSAGNKKKSGLS